jgi:diguanylate cyclase (GGDEF)-like protein/PAS domain S-box-containing protein
MLPPEKVLIVSAEEQNRSRLDSILQGDYQTQTAKTGKEAFAMLRHDNFAAVLLDLGLSQREGYFFLEQRIQEKKCSRIPVVVAAESNDAQSERRALELGAWDYVNLHDDPEIIRMRVRLALTHSDLTSYRKLQYLAHYDPLTGLYNKTAFFSAVKKLIADYPGQRFAFIRFDINGFRLINRFFGMAAGDCLLTFLASQIPLRVKKYGKYAYGRMERDIFAICVPYSDQVLKDIEDVRAKLVRSNGNYSLVPCFGIYVIDDRSVTVEYMNNCAYVASQTRKGDYFKCYALYTDAMEQRIRRQQSIQNEMYAALEKHQFVVYLQPKYDLHSNSFAGAEALVRWIHPEKGVIAPGEFIPVFEKNGFISKLDYYVWESVCQLLHKWIEAGKTPLPISVNVSRVDLCCLSVADRIIALAKQYQVPPKYLNLEITESAYTNNPELLKAITASLQLNGFKVLMDDFGSGYSSLNMLQDINIDEMKLDMRFFSGKADNKRGEDIIVAMIHMAKWLHIPVVAEGVETKAQVEFLRRAGCEYVQGYFFGKPAPVTVYEEALSDGHDMQEPAIRALKKEQNISEMQDFMFDTVLDGMALCEFDDDNITVLRANDSFFKFFALLGHTPPMHENVLKLLKPEEREEMLSLMYKCEFSRSNVQLEHCFERDDGSSLWADINLRYLARNGTRCIQMLTMGDITAQKQVQEQSKQQD